MNSNSVRFESPYLQCFLFKGCNGWVVNIRGDKWVQVISNTIRLIINVSSISAHKLSSCGFASSRRSRQPNKFALIFRLNLVITGRSFKRFSPPVDLYWFFEISIWAIISDWNKNRVQN